VSTVFASETNRAAALGGARRKAREWFALDEEATSAIFSGLSGNIAEMGRILEVDVGSSDDLMLLLSRAQEDLLSLSVGATVELEDTKKRMRDLQSKATTDALTGIRNRAAFQEALDQHWSVRLSGKDTSTLGLIIADVDHFKRFNDTYGHQAGDEVLRAVAQTLERTCRKSDRPADVVCRYGGEEFVVILPQLTQADLRLIAERFRASIESMGVASASGMLKVTASFGACLVKRVRPGQKPDAVLKAADENLYAAKKAGRNRCVVSVFPDP
jgi:diguanylate cyclase (GGDEF)-like protein